MSDSAIFIGSGPGGAHPQQLELSRANRHGLIAGATGTGKTKTLQLLAGQLSKAGVPVFVADIKGDLTGLAAPGDRARRRRHGGRPGERRGGAGRAARRPPHVG